MRTSCASTCARARHGGAHVCGIELLTLDARSAKAFAADQRGRGLRGEIGVQLVQQLLELEPLGVSAVGNRRKPRGIPVELWPVGLLPDPAVNHYLSLIDSYHEAVSALESLHGQQR
jgi:hypothetical protein